MPTQYEQQMVDLINSARTDPAGISDKFLLGLDINFDLPPGSINLNPKVPLVWSDKLASVARTHVDWMLANKQITHEPPAGNPLTRVLSSGYPAEEAMENAGLHGSYVFLGNEPYAMESLNGDFLGHGGHRYQMLFDGHREVGLAYTIDWMQINPMSYSYPCCLIDIIFASPKIRIVSRPPIRSPFRPTVLPELP